jgi:hypothetical protein
VGFWLKTYRTPFLVQKILTIKSGISALLIEERLTNQGYEPVDFMWGHHPVVGEPFLSEDCRISAPESVVQIYHDEDGPIIAWASTKKESGRSSRIGKAGRSICGLCRPKAGEQWITVISRNSRRVDFGPEHKTRHRHRVGLGCRCIQVYMALASFWRRYQISLVWKDSLYGN